MDKPEKKKKRVRRRDRERLKQLKEREDVQEAAGKDADELNYDDVLDVVLPDEVGDAKLSRPEEDMVFMELRRDREVIEKLEDLAGENVSTHEVVHHFINAFEATHET